MMIITWWWWWLHCIALHWTVVTLRPLRHAAPAHPVLLYFHSSPPREEAWHCSAETKTARCSAVPLPGSWWCQRRGAARFHESDHLKVPLKFQQFWGLPNSKDAPSNSICNLPWNSTGNKAPKCTSAFFLLDGRNLQGLCEFLQDWFEALNR